MLTQRPHPNQRQFSGKEIQELRQFIYPQLAHYLAPGGDAEIVLEFPTFLQIVRGVHISLQVFTVGMHSAELLHVDGFAVQALTFQADQGSIGGIHILSGFSALAQDEVHDPINLAFVNQFKTAKVESAHYLRFG